MVRFGDRDIEKITWRVVFVPQDKRRLPADCPDGLETSRTLFDFTSKPALLHSYLRVFTGSVQAAVHACHPTVAAATARLAAPAIKKTGKPISIR